MSKSLIFTVNSKVQDLKPNQILNPGSVARRFGPNFALEDDGTIKLLGTGYFKITANFTITTEEEEDIVLTTLHNGVEVPGIGAAATSQPNGIVNLTLVGVIRESYRNIEGASSDLQFKFNDAETATLVNSSIVIEKL